MSNTTTILLYNVIVFTTRYMFRPEHVIVFDGVLFQLNLVLFVRLLVDRSETT
jgi:hypothetical protein